MKPKKTRNPETGCANDAASMALADIKANQSTRAAYGILNRKDVREYLLAMVQAALDNKMPMPSCGALATLVKRHFGIAVSRSGIDVWLHRNVAEDELRRARNGET
jgi:hypothetical protein